MSAHTTRLDVRDSATPPFERIDDALTDLGPEERLTLINGFEPEPLYDVLERRGFRYETTRVTADEWHVEIERA
ncbi:DUF2249 domain-containing protein [Halopenitus persicus]|uniref:DUF2249 domain-containing protein n=1 Tax=Halopenitus persicus TaxID=1048396 RepID=UPI000BBB2E32|nr:DUF2249 domain-containing protein [Halopenitus persicus]